MQASCTLGVRQAAWESGRRSTTAAQRSPGRRERRAPPGGQSESVSPAGGSGPLSPFHVRDWTL